MLAIGLYHPKTPENVGSVLRLAYCLRADIVIVEGGRVRQSCTDTYGALNLIPVIRGSLRDCIPWGCVPVAVELLPEAESLVSYEHPKRAFYIFGPEDGGLGKPTTEWCRDVVSIPTDGCLNLATTAAMVLYDRIAKGN